MRPASQNEASLKECGWPHWMRPASQNEARLTEWGRPHKWRQPHSKNEAVLTEWGLPYRMRQPHTKNQAGLTGWGRLNRISLFSLNNAQNSIKELCFKTTIWHIQSQNLEIRILRQKKKLMSAWPDPPQDVAKTCRFPLLVLTSHFVLWFRGEWRLDILNRSSEFLPV